MKFLIETGIRKLKGEVANIRAYEDTLKRLLKGDFKDLSPEERQHRVEQIIQAGATTAMALGAAPIPFLETPVMAAMVRAIGKVHGTNQTGKRALLELAGAMGGGLALRQLSRLIPIGGSVVFASRIYGATWALGRAADLYFSSQVKPSSDDIRQVYEETMDRKMKEQEGKMNASDFETRLKELDDLLKRKVITPEEYRKKREQLLESL